MPRVAPECLQKKIIMGNTFSDMTGYGQVAKSTAELAIAGMKHESERYKTQMDSMTEIEKIQVEKMKVFFSFVGAANSKSVDAIQEIAGGMVELARVLGDSNVTIVKEYQITLRSLGNNMATCTEASGRAMEHVVKFTSEKMQERAMDVVDKAVQKTLSNIQEVSKLIVKLSSNRDERYDALNNKILENIAFTQTILQELCQNKEAFKELVIRTANDFRQVEG